MLHQKHLSRLNLENNLLILHQTQLTDMSTDRNVKVKFCEPVLFWRVRSIIFFVEGWIWLQLNSTWMISLRGHVSADGGGEVTLREVVLHIQLTHLHTEVISYFLHRQKNLCL